MKKIALLLAILLILSCVSGCGASASTQEDDGALQQQVVDLQEENATLKQQVADLQEENSSLQQQIEALQKPVEDASSAENTADYEAQESIESSVEEEPVEETTSDAETFDVSETEIRGGTNQADATQIPLNTKVYGTLHDGQNMYGTFHTGGKAGSRYQITVVNKLPDDDNASTRVRFFIFDVLGTEVANGSAYSNGIASTIVVEGLSSDTDYYVRLVVMHNRWEETRDDTADFSLKIQTLDEESEGINTSNDLVSSISTSDNVDQIVVGNNQDDSALIPLDMSISGTLEDGLGEWFAFRTGVEEDTDYLISVIDKSLEDVRVRFFVYDELGTAVADGSAYNDGITATINVNGLSPSTVYYLRFIVMHPRWEETRSTAVDYDFIIRCQNNTPEANMAMVEDAEDVVFETPFELSSTQVRFVADQAVFIDENEAKEALAPVAEIILAHPDHPILLAGTTAEWGNQESCVALSNRRADAVKDLLVSYFGVPESQLITVGLGYEADPFVRGRDVDSNGNFVETEGAKNRRVVVLDAESDIARQILGN